jgi:hypothetical protein
MKPIDRLGLGPKREAVRNDKGYLVTVTPPDWSGFSPSSIQLTDDQYARYLLWHSLGSLIQDVLPELSKAQLEILITGIDDREFHEATREPEE